MAKPGQIPYADAIHAIALGKEWSGGGSLKWIVKGPEGFPDHHKCRANISINGVIQEGYFVDIFHKKSTIDGIPDKVSIALIVNSARILALDENGPSQHANTVGKGHPFYQQIADHPHLHVPTAESSAGYAEPLKRTSIEDLWQVFLDRANINNAPPFNFPQKDSQMDLL